MRVLPAALTAAVTAGNGTPECRVELIDAAPHYAAVFTGGPSGRHGAAIAADGALVQAYNDGAGPGHIYVRRVGDPTQSSWGAWTALTAAAGAGAGVAVCRLSDRVRVLWQENATTFLDYSDSFDSGVSWSAAAQLFDPGAACSGVAADVSAGIVFVVYVVAANDYRVAVWTLGGGWVKTDWTNGDAYAAPGLGVVQNPDGSYLVAIAWQLTVGVGIAVDRSVYRPPGLPSPGWSALSAIVPADVGAGVAIADPHLSSYDNLVHLSYALVDSGATSGLVYARVAVAHTVDQVHWTDPLEDGNAYAHGAVALKHARGYVLAAPDTSALAPLYTGAAAQYRDCTADLVRLEIRQHDGTPAEAVLILENDAGQYAALAALRPKARLRLSLGYAGAGTVYTHVLYVADWAFTRLADESIVTIRAKDATSWLARQSRTTLQYSNRTVDDLTREVLTRAGLLTLQLAATTQFSQSVANFVIPAGHTWLQALHRLSSIYGYDVAARAQADGTDVVVVLEKNPADAVAWSYGDEIDELRVGTGGDRANHVLVYGATGVSSVGEAWDFGDAGSVSQEKYLHQVEPLITTLAGLGVRATLELNVEKRRARFGRIVAPMNPALELWDVVATSDAVIGPASVRVQALHHVYEPHPGLYDLVLDLEGA